VPKGKQKYIFLKLSVSFFRDFYRHPFCVPINRRTKLAYRNKSFAHSPIFFKRPRNNPIRYVFQKL